MFFICLEMSVFDCHKVLMLLNSGTLYIRKKNNNKNNNKKKQNKKKTKKKNTELISYSVLDDIIVHKCEKRADQAISEPSCTRIKRLNVLAGPSLKSFLMVMALVMKV